MHIDTFEHAEIKINPLLRDPTEYVVELGGLRLGWSSEYNNTDSG
jgi:hypothetical protein